MSGEEEMLSPMGGPRDLTAEQSELLAAFSELTGADGETATHVLEAHGWDLNAGVDFFLENGVRPPPPQPQPQPQPQPPLEIPDSPPPEVLDDEAVARAYEESAAAAVAASLSREEDPMESPIAVEGHRFQAFSGSGSERPGPRSVDEGVPDLPEGIDMEEARMLEAAMFGTVYEGRIPDFSNPTPPTADVPPELMEQRLLRGEQDAAYHASLRADQERIAAEEAAAREEREARVLEERRKEEEERAYSRMIEAKTTALGSEPPADAEGVIQVQIRLPDGSRLSRVFFTSDPMSRLFDFVDVSMAALPGGPGEALPSSYTLATQFPRRVFEESSAGTLDSNGLNHKQEALFLQKK